MIIVSLLRLTQNSKLLNREISIYSTSSPGLLVSFLTSGEKKRQQAWERGCDLLICSILNICLQLLFSAFKISWWPVSQLSIKHVIFLFFNKYTFKLICIFQQGLLLKEFSSLYDSLFVALKWLCGRVDYTQNISRCRQHLILFTTSGAGFF